MASNSKRKLDDDGDEECSKKPFVDSSSDEDERRSGTINIGSRKSQLAVVQTENIMRALRARYPDLTLVMETMETLGDKILDLPLPKIGEKSLFTKDLEIALESRKVDFLVHSLKDLPTSMPAGMAISTIYKRDDPRDCVIFHPRYQGKKLADLPPNSVIGTSSLRRIAQLKRRYQHLTFESIRGNLNTRLRKLQEHDKFAAIVLAQAGVDRMNWKEKVGQTLEEDECLYAIGQGAMAVEIRRDDKFMAELLSELSDIPTLLTCVAERSFMKTLNGGCSTPIGCYSRYLGNKLSLHGVVLNETGSICLEETLNTDITTYIPDNGERTFVCSDSGVLIFSRYQNELRKAEKLGADLAFALKGLGADEVLAAVRANLPKVTNIQVPSSSSVKLS